MGKKQKTRKQKIIADFRRELYSLRSQNIAPLQPKVSLDPQMELMVPSTMVNAYPYLLPDILKTAILTISISAMQIILFFLLKSHILKLPGISY